MSAIVMAALLVLGQAESNQKIPDNKAGQKAKGDQKGIANLSSLMDRDWSNDRYAISLHADGDEVEGTAWFFRFDNNKVNGWRGRFKFFRSSDSPNDTLILQVGFQREYEVTKDESGYKWVINTRYRMQGMYVEIPIENSHVPDRVIQLSVTSGYWSDENGKPTVRTTQADGFRGSVLGLKEEVKLRTLYHVDIGDTLELTDIVSPRYKGTVASLPPPGFKPRVQKRDEQVVTANKPVTSAPAGQGPAPGTAAILAIRLHIIEKNFEEARKACDVFLVQQEPRNHFVWYLRGVANEELGNIEDAIRDYTAACNLDRNDIDYFWKRANAHERVKNFSAAAYDFRRCVELNSTMDTALNALAWNYATRKDFADSDAKEAVNLARKAVELTGAKNYLYVDTLAAAYARAGDFPEAIRAQEEAVRLAPSKDKADYTSRLQLYRSRKPYLQ